MSEAVVKYNPDSNPHAEILPHCDELRLLANKQNNPSSQYDELTVLSKRKARALLKIGNDTLNRLINEGLIKIILLNGKEKIPFVSLQEYIYSMHTKNEIENDNYKLIDEEEAVAIANKILEEYNKGER